MFVATLIAAGKLTGEVVREAIDRLDATEHEVGAPHWIDEGDAADIFFQGSLVSARAELAKMDHGALDVVVQPLGDRTKKLIIADMDSTMITVECIDELADYAGIKPQIAAITERAMQGELDFESALRERVALLEGLSESAIEQCLAERIKPMEGARTLVETLRSKGCRTVLVTGGFHHFADPVAEQLGFEHVVANRLEVEGGKLTGGLIGPITDSVVKRATLEEEMGKLGAGAISLATGDGANDVPMLQAADYGVAFRAKPVARDAATGRIDRGDLTSLLKLLDIPESEWIAG